MHHVHRSGLRPWALLSLCLLASCVRTPQELVVSGPTMGTTYTVKVVAPPPGVDEQAVKAEIDAVLQRIDLAMSGYRSDSEIAQFNKSPSTDWYEVSADLAGVVQTGLEISVQSGGAFDMTVAPLVNIWGFGVDDAIAGEPEEAMLAELRRRVGYDKLHVRTGEAPALRKDIPELSVDLNGVAPGYAVDLLSQDLSALSIDNFMIELGGEVRVRGRNAQGERWRIAVERPVDDEPTPFAILELEDVAVTTSGEYRHYYERGGKRYSHTIDPRTGRPVEHTLASVVVIGPSATRVDAWATAFNVLGAEEGYALASKLELPVMFIEQRGERLEQRMTPAFAPFILRTGETGLPQ